VKEKRKEYLAVILLPVFLHCRSQQLILRNDARQNCSAGEQGAAFTKQQGALVQACSNAPSSIPSLQVTTAHYQECCKAELPSKRARCHIHKTTRYASVYLQADCHTPSSYLLPWSTVVLTLKQLCHLPSTHISCCQCWARL